MRRVLRAAAFRHPAGVAESAQAERDHPLRRPGFGLRRRRARGPRRSCSSSESLCSAFVMECRRWRCSSAARSSRRRSASSAGPTCTCASTAHLLRDLPEEQQCWMSHRDTVYEAPPGSLRWPPATSRRLRRSSRLRRGLYGIQFHPEVVHTPLRHRRSRSASSTTSVKPMASGAPHRSSTNRSPRSARRSATGKVDLRIVGRRRQSRSPRCWFTRRSAISLTCVFVDHGMMRKNEAEQVVAVFRDNFQVPLIHVDAGHLFGAPRGRLRPGAEAQDDRRSVHPHVSRKRRRSSTRSSWCRARCIPT